MKSGGCLCGAVTYQLSGPLRPSVACHCNQCRKTSGHYVSATQMPGEALVITRDDGLTWFQSSEKARRGFCNKCGSSLFWCHEDDGGAVSVMSGTIDGATGMITAKHIFVADKGDYYDIPAGVEKRM